MSSHTFAQIPKAEIQRSSFDRSHGHKTTIDGGILYPIFLDEALPGDTFNLKMHAVARLATPIFPIMDNIYIDTFFFAVPYRLIWDNWERFNGSRDNPNSSVDYIIPSLNGVCAEGTLGDYFGLPIGLGINPANALPFRAYYEIWNEWFRDQNLQNSLVINKGDTSQTFPEFVLQYRGKRHDYFTSCLPWPQKGETVEIPLGSTAPVIPTSTHSVPTWWNTTANSAAGALKRTATTANSAVNITSGSGNASDPLGWDNPNLVADLSNATAATINSLRQAFQIQKMLERDARGGTRYTEIIKAHFNVTSPDARLQRPEYLGGFSQPVQISEIHQTQATQATITPLGQVGAIGRAVLNGNRNGFTSSFSEHCIIIGLVNVRAELTYQNNINRMWSRRTRYDHYWPALAHIGEQAVLNKELWYSATANDELVFGYQERYAEYRYKPSMVTGKMRSAAVGSLDAWHLALEFGAAPVLNGTFITDQPPIDRVIAVPAEPQFILDSWFELQCARPMPMFGVPGLIDHF